MWPSGKIRHRSHHPPQRDALTRGQWPDPRPVPNLGPVVQTEPHQVGGPEHHQVGHVRHEAGVGEPAADLVLVCDLAPVAALVRQRDRDHGDQHQEPGGVVNVTGAAGPGALRLRNKMDSEKFEMLLQHLGDSGVVPVDVDPLLHLGLSVPHDGVKVSALTQLDL